MRYVSRIVRLFYAGWLFHLKSLSNSLFFLLTRCCSR